MRALPAAAFIAFRVLAKTLTRPFLSPGKGQTAHVRYRGRFMIDENKSQNHKHESALRYFESGFGRAGGDASPDTGFQTNCLVIAIGDYVHSHFGTKDYPAKALMRTQREVDHGWRSNRDEASGQQAWAQVGRKTAGVRSADSTKLVYCRSFHPEKYGLREWLPPKGGARCESI